MPRETIKTSVKYESLLDKKNILCITQRTTGFDWILIRDEYGNEDRQSIWITGVAVPQGDIGLTQDFILGWNTFVFYVEERRVVYCELLRESVIEYVVSGWDVLYPIRRDSANPFNWISSRKYMTEADLAQ